jgi:hypothetical protein
MADSGIGHNGADASWELFLAGNKARYSTTPEIARFLLCESFEIR